MEINDDLKTSNLAGGESKAASREHVDLSLAILKVAIDDIICRLKFKREKRRVIGWFDHSSDSWDMHTTTQRAFRIHQRLLGKRTPLTTPHELPVRWNAYHR